MDSEFVKEKVHIKNAKEGLEIGFADVYNLVT